MRVINRNSWGKISKSIDSHLFDISESNKLSELSGKSKGIPVGLGRSYGDAAISNLGDYWSVENLNSIEIDNDRKIAKCGAGATIKQLEMSAIANRLFPFVVPGTAFVTIGGCIASDVHGKSHHLHGSFGNHVVSMEILTSDGKILKVTPNGNYSDLFWATVGGMGLTGIILSAEIKLMPLANPMIRTHESRFDSFDEMLKIMREYDDKFTFTVGWIDIREKNRFRGIITGGNLNSQPGKTLEKMLQQKLRKFKFPNIQTSILVNNFFIRIFNAIWYKKPLKNRELSILKFMHPLDGIENWNNIYGSKGFYQFQCVIPENVNNKLYEILEFLSANKIYSFVTVLKKLGKPSSGILSFPEMGWTLAVDIPRRKANTEKLIFKLNSMTVEAGGKVYLAKDSFLNGNEFRTMYPKSRNFKKIKAKYDPNNYWVSDQSARLGLN